MTKQEFIKRQQSLNRGINWRFGVLIALLFAGVLGVVSLSRYIETHPEDYRWIAKAVLISLLVLLFVCLVLLLWVAIRQQRCFGHRCPSCHKPFLGVHVPLIIATGNCGFCGEKVFDEDAKPAEVHPAA